MKRLLLISFKLLALIVFVITLTGTDKLEAATDKTKPTMSPSYTVLNQKATIKLHGKDTGSGLSYARYIKGTLADPSSSKWSSKATKISGTTSFQVTSSGNYSILLADKAGNKIVKKINVQIELKGVWISYLEFSSAKISSMSYTKFKTYVNTVFNKCKSNGLNTVIVQVRPCGDAMYKSSYFPWSVYVSGKQGTSPGYDPMKYMITAAHNRGLAFYAWINPYRISMSGTTSVTNLATSNQARKWRNSAYTSVKRNVLTYNSQLYFNPSKSSVQTLIVNGVKEIVKNYDIEGIIFDDYFYPSLGNSYQSNFDASEYKSYKTTCTLNGTKANSIVVWRRNNVNTLLKKVKTAIKNIDATVQFGVSPQGNISNLKSKTANYCDVDTWMSSNKYMDFISPQIYWSTTNSVSPFKKVLKQWINLRTSSSSVNIYASLAAYKAGISLKEASGLSPVDTQWATSSTNLKRQVEYGRDTGIVDGFMLYRYDNIVSSKAKKEMSNLSKIIK